LRYLARLPTRSAESGSLALCAVHFLSLPSDPAVASNALAIRIIFPLIRVMPVFFQQAGFASSAGQTNKRPPGSDPSGLHFVVLNVSINKKPISVSEVVIKKT